MQSNHLISEEHLSDTRGYASRNDAIDQLRRFGWSMVSLAASVGLYFMGFFNSVQGPLNSDRMGTTLAQLGVTSTHLIAGAAVLFVLSVSWNWIYNLFHRSAAKRRSGMNTGHKNRNIDRAQVYEPVRKGPWGHVLWMAMLILLITLLANVH